MERKTRLVRIEIYKRTTIHVYHHERTTAQGHAMTMLEHV